ncbi:hypothetical protein OAP99_01475 [Flavobacteriaceae bacterium]|nr:hypothetical protein [Flavobacteriaceae bacterium]MDC1060841.1 hypothetical protein [Flavobacteriaceae bacterium]
MLNPIKKELIRLAHEILGQNESLNTKELLEKVQQLYKQLILIEHHEDQETSTDSSHAEVAPLMETINEMVTEMPLDQESAAIEDLFVSVTNPVFIKKEEEKELPPLPKTLPDNSLPKNLNDFLGKGIQIGLNDRLAFIKNLFEGSAEDYQRVLSQVQTYSDWEEAQLFIQEMIKPDYNNWEGKEEFETRFLKCIETNF